MPAWQSSRRTGSALAPAGFAFLVLVLAVGLCAGAARAADDARTVPTPRRSYTRAYAALGAGVGLTVASFFIAERADKEYAHYLEETDPFRIEDEFQQAKRLDRLSAGGLIAGQAGLALGIYWRFLRHPRAQETLGAAVGAAPAPTWTVVPAATRDGGVGLALDVRF